VGSTCTAASAVPSATAPAAIAPLRAIAAAPPPAPPRASHASATSSSVIIVA
jgi:hypothetical protein